MPREGPRHDGDAHLLLAAHVHALAQLPYGALLARSGSAVRELVDGLDGTAYVRCTRVVRERRGGEEQVRLVVDVAPPGGAAVAEEVLVATPDGRVRSAWSRPGAASRRSPDAAPVGLLAAGAVLAVLLAVTLLVALG
ncbi:hypothetical protein [Vallicoccus soli]|uniref:hypothetical protein n=1 Tax=Vallicoccus soli TaxID=2339232 RepID=UPI0010597E6D|nr:hypothetical protein [Vallicoccus soli]